MSGARLWTARTALLLSALSFLTAAFLPAWTGGARPRRVVATEEARPAEALWDYAVDRSALREEEIRQLLLLAAEAETPEIREAAQRRMLDLRRWMEQEATLEAVLSARGYAPVLVTVSRSSANVLVAAERVAKADAAVMLELVTRETGIAGSNVRIVPTGG